VLLLALLPRYHLHRAHQRVYLHQHQPQHLEVPVHQYLRLFHHRPLPPLHYHQVLVLALAQVPRLLIHLAQVCQRLFLPPPLTRPQVQPVHLLVPQLRIVQVPLQVLLNPLVHHNRLALQLVPVSRRLLLTVPRQVPQLHAVLLPVLRHLKAHQLVFQPASHHQPRFLPPPVLPLQYPLRPRLAHHLPIVHLHQRLFQLVLRHQPLLALRPHLQSPQ